VVLGVGGSSPSLTSLTYRKLTSGFIPRVLVDPRAALSGAERCYLPPVGGPLSCPGVNLPR